MNVNLKMFSLAGMIFGGLLTGLFADEVAQTEKEVASLAVQMLEPRLGLPFQDNMVLQQEIHLPVWGLSLPGAKVTVAFENQTETVESDAEGQWRVVLDPMTAVRLSSVNEAPAGKKMTVICEKDGEKAVKEIGNILIGDVWLCAGQSNMAGGMKANRANHWPTNTIELADHPALRRMPGDGKPWTICSPDTVGEFGKVAFFFARRVQRDALVPIGLMRRAVGGSSIESWLNKQPYAPGGNYASLMEPLVGYGIKGAIWYQGESNAKDGLKYQDKLESLITGWREAWGQGDFHFYFVQLPGLGQSSLDNPAGGDGRAAIRQAYMNALRLKNTGMAVTIDVGTPGEHPPNKYDTGDRLARVALRKAYGMETVSISPLYKSHRVEGDSIRVTFDDVGSGLMVAKKEGFLPPVPAPDEKIDWLSVQGKDGVWHWADGKIDGEELVVSCKDVKEPKAVRYAYTHQPLGYLLYNRDGQPVGPFSTCGHDGEK